MNLEMYIEITRISNEESLKDLDKNFFLRRRNSWSSFKLLGFLKEFDKRKNVT